MPDHRLPPRKRTRQAEIRASDANPEGVFAGIRAHLGGFSSGLLFAAPMIPRLGSPRPLFQMRLKVAVGMLTGILVLFGFYLAQLPR
jgi:rhomboid protease GluP